ncbi:MAG: hypothetical protein LBH58_09015, partial [Tannerellaceae bacterium]|nr:hypothetical protein [Tannerellaceae bacterium]
MKTELELKDIACYLPYKLKVVVCKGDAFAVCTRTDFDGKEIKIDERDAHTMGRDFNGAEYVDVGDCACVPLKKVTPILRPLS